MMQTILEFEKENIGGAQIRDICDKLQRDELKALSLRECVLTDKDYKRILKLVGGSTNLRHLSLTIGVIPDTFRVHVLAQTLQKNKSLTGLFIHGNEIGEAGIKMLYPSLVKHPHLHSLDVGDCGIGDEGLNLLSQLLVQKHEHPGLEELVLSSNPDITAKGWTKLGVAISAGCNLRCLYVDYNELGDSSASCLLVALAGTKSLETLDMECVGVTETTGQVFLHLLQNYSVAVTNINLDENNISQTTLEAIKSHIPGLVEEELNNSINSDDERSLAMSEPPLDPNTDFEDLAGSVNCITIVGATGSPAYTPDTADVMVTDRSIPTEEDMPDHVANNENVTFVNEAEHATHNDSDLIIETEVQNIGDIEKTLEKEVETQEKEEPDVKFPRKPESSKKGKRGSRTKTESLADCIKSQRDRNVDPQSVTAVPVTEKEDKEPVLSDQGKALDAANNDGLFIVRSKEILDDHELDRKGETHTQLTRKVDSVEEIEDIEEMDEKDIDSAHNILTIPATPSKMSLCSGPGVKSTSSIFDDKNLLRLSPSHNINKHRRYSHNVEISKNDIQNLQGQSKHRGSEGNISARFMNRRASTPNNARLTVHGVGSSTNIDEMHSTDTRRRLSNASTLGDVQ